MKPSLLTSFQFGFKANNSNELAITSFYDNLLNNINESKTTCSIFPDLSEAFDSVNHSILLKKLYHYGLREKIFNFLTSYLTDHQICSKIGSIVFSPQIVDQGVPQRLVLSPLLFLFYVNDLPHASNFDTTLFADDTNLHLSHHNINILQSLVNQKTNKINQWMISNKLTKNYKKSCYMIVSKRTLDTFIFNVSINHNKIEKTT